MSGKENKIDPLKHGVFFELNHLREAVLKDSLNIVPLDVEQLIRTCQWLFEVVERYDEEMCKLLPLLDDEQQRAIGIEPEKIKEISDKVFEELKNKISKGL